MRAVPRYMQHATSAQQTTTHLFFNIVEHDWNNHNYLYIVMVCV